MNVSGDFPHRASEVDCSHAKATVSPWKSARGQTPRRKENRARLDARELLEAAFLKFVEGQGGLRMPKPRPRARAPFPPAASWVRGTRQSDPAFPPRPGPRLTNRRGADL